MLNVGISHTFCCTSILRSLSPSFNPTSSSIFIKIIQFLHTSFEFLFNIPKSDMSYPNFIQVPLFVGMRPLLDHFKMFNTHCRGICKVSGRFGKKTAKNTKVGGELIKHGGRTQETSSKTF